MVSHLLVREVLRAVGDVAGSGINIGAWEREVVSMMAVEVLIVVGDVLTVDAKQEMVSLSHYVLTSGSGQ